MKPDDDLAIDPFLPAIVIGYRVDGAIGARLRNLEGMPPWMVWWEHQYGGYATEHVELAGVLALLTHAPGAHEDRGLVLEGIEALADERKVRRFPALRGLHLTFGGPLGASEIEMLSRFLAKGFDLPPIERAFEAFVELAACDLQRSFGGWPIVAYEIPARSHLADSDAHHLVLGPRAVRKDRCVDARLLGAVAQCGKELGSEGSPRAFLVWSNAD